MKEFPMFPSLPPASMAHDPDVEMLQQRAMELYHARVEERRCKLECLTADGLIALGRAYPPTRGSYLADALLAEFCRRIAEPLDEAATETLRRSSIEALEAVHPGGPLG
jgi:hypothetical protein